MFCIISCRQNREERGVELFNTQCASCHVAPNLQDLPKDIWQNSVLPDMGARMGIYDPNYSPLKGLSFSEQEQIVKSGIYTRKAVISLEDWVLLKEYIIKSAPDSLEEIPKLNITKKMPLFTSNAINLDSIPGSSICFIDINDDGRIITANLSGNISSYNYHEKIVNPINSFESPVTSYTKKDSLEYFTTIGFLNPSELSNGGINQRFRNSTKQIGSNLHRPVHTTVYDFDKDGKDEFLVSEFGHLTGVLSMWKQDDNEDYKKTVLLAQPGIVRTVVQDMNADGKVDIVLMSTQGNEGVSILYQEDNLSFSGEQVLRFSPVYGSSWFELLDYDGDGYQDIVTVNGDNADKSYVHKPYHGLRIHINDGKNNFEEKYFYPMHGTTRFVAEDFDEDGDVDFGVLSSFPDYENNPNLSFIYLKNINSTNYKFESFILEEPSIGRWLLLDAGDIDNDGDKDIVLSAFSYYFTPIPEDLDKKWTASNIDLLVLENTMK